MNFLEQLLAEWFEYRGYFVRRNVRVGPRSKGGYECELDIVAFHPERKHLVHVEPSTDADSYEIRDRRYEKKFAAGRKYVPGLFTGLKIPAEIEQYSVFHTGTRKNGREEIGGRPFKLLKEVVVEILADLKSKPMQSSAVPENLALLRLLQVVAKHRGSVIDVLQG